MRGVGSLQSLGLGCGIGVHGPPADIPDRTEMEDGTQSLAKETYGLLSAADSAFKSMVLRENNSVKSSVAEIKPNLHLMHTTNTSCQQVQQPKACFV